MMIPAVSLPRHNLLPDRGQTLRPPIPNCRGPRLGIGSGAVGRHRGGLPARLRAVRSKDHAVHQSCLRLRRAVQCRHRFPVSRRAARALLHKGRLRPAPGHHPAAAPRRRGRGPFLPDARRPEPAGRAILPAAADARRAVREGHGPLPAAVAERQRGLGRPVVGRIARDRRGLHVQGACLEHLSRTLVSNSRGGARLRQPFQSQHPDRILVCRACGRSAPSRRRWQSSSCRCRCWTGLPLHRIWRNPTATAG